MKYTFFHKYEYDLKGHERSYRAQRERQRERVTESERESVCERERN